MVFPEVCVSWIDNALCLSHWETLICARFSPSERFEKDFPSCTLVRLSSQLNQVKSGAVEITSMNTLQDTKRHSRIGVSPHVLPTHGRIHETQSAGKKKDLLILDDTQIFGSELALMC